MLTLWPWIERRFTGDRTAHHLLDRPRDAPAHTATGLAGLVLFFIAFLAGGNDVLAVLLNVSVETVTRILRYALFIAPLLTWLVAFSVCRWLRATRVHPATPTAGVRLAARPVGGTRPSGRTPGPAADTSVRLPGRASSSYADGSVDQPARQAPPFRPTALCTGSVAAGHAGRR
jgi:hypothetical protein